MSTEIILLERVGKLGQMGDVVKVKPGYARNFLLPQRKALRATKENISFFEAQRKVLEAQNLERKADAEKIAKKLDGLKVVILRQAAESGHLYGSVSSRDIAEAIESSAKIAVTRNQVLMDTAFKSIGLFQITLSLHPEVSATLTLNIARSEEEAKTQEKTGKAVIVDYRADDRKEERKSAAGAQKPAAGGEQPVDSEQSAA